MKEIKTIKEWCQGLVDHAETIKKYENLLSSFYKYLDRYDIDYLVPFLSGCYKKETFKGQVPKYLSKRIGVCGILSVISGIIFFIVALFIKMSDDHSGAKNTAENAGKLLIPAIIVMGCTFILYEFLYIYFKYRKYKSMKKQLEQIEIAEKDFMITVPVNYRTSEKMQLISRVYFHKPDIDPSIILKCVSDYMNLPNYERACKYAAIMVDLPSECPFLQVSDSAKEQKIIEEKKQEQRNPYLPKDIDTKLMQGSANAKTELNAMIGLESVKDQIDKFKNRIEFYGKNSNNGCHLAFLGGAGSGKTTCARIVTKLLFDLGYIENNQYLEISGDYLCAGDTNRAAAIIEYAYGRVLFIDEAYLMYGTSGYGTNSEVVGVLLKAMEDHRKDFVVILAGYEEQMTKLIASNEGFSSRIKHTIYFPDYTEDEMLAIFNYFIKDYNGKSYKLNPDAIPFLKSAFTLEKKAKSFGNARTVRNAVDAIMDYYADRCIRGDKNNGIIEISDVEHYYEDRKVFIQHETKNASAADQVDEQIIRLSELKHRLKNGSENPEQDINEFEAIDDILNEINILKNQKEFYNNIVAQKILLLGDEACAKEPLAKVLTGYLYQLGYITENTYLDIPAEFLKGSFVGHTAKRAQAIIKYASGGVLFIRNYNLLYSTDNNGDSFASEALTAIAEAISDQNVTLIIADYDSDYINNIKNQFTMIYEFPAYTDEQIYNILIKAFNKKDFLVEETEALPVLWNYVCTHKDINMNTINSIVTNTIKHHISNYNSNDGEEKKYLIVKDDITFVPTITFNINL